MDHLNWKNDKKSKWKEKLSKKMTEYFINTIYLAIFLGVFTWYRRLTLAQYQVSYLEYGASIIEALILGKVIMIGDVMRLGRRFKTMPLFFTTIYKSVVFTAFIFIFTIIEHAIRGLINGKSAAGGLTDFLSNRHELIARNLVIFFAFIPFFAFKELERVIGKNKIRQIFFHRA